MAAPARAVNYARRQTVYFVSSRCEKDELRVGARRFQIKSKLIII